MTGKQGFCAPRARTVLALLLLASLAGPVEVRADDSALRVTVTVPPLAWLVSEVAGPEVVVEHLVEVGEVPETFQPTDLKITRVARSALFFRIGIPAENGPWLRTLAASETLELVDLRQGLELRAMDSHHGDHHPAVGHPEAHGKDPHLWLSPRRLQTMATTVAQHLAAVDPLNSADYVLRATQLQARLDALDATLKERLAPVRGRSFFIFHPAWGYFADDYDLHQVAIEIEGKEPTERELTQLVRQARKLDARALFVQPQTHSTTPAILARTLGARLDTLDTLAHDVPANLLLAADRLLAALLPETED